VRPGWVEAAYLLTVATIATCGFALDSTVTVLVALLLALPTSVAATIGYYVIYGLLAMLPGANLSSSSGAGSCSSGGDCHTGAAGDPAAWFTVTTDVIAVLALTGAALLNLVLYRKLAERRRRRV
jgi:hypothetical protein